MKIKTPSTAKNERIVVNIFNKMKMLEVIQTHIMHVRVQFWQFSVLVFVTKGNLCQMSKLQKY